MPAVGKDIMERLEAQVVFPDDDMAPADLVVADQKLLRMVTDLDGVYAALLTYIELVESLGVDETDLHQRLEQELSDTSANRSVFLTIALDDVTILKGAVATMPEDTGLTQRLNAAQARVTVASQALQSSVALMNGLELETRQYRQQLLTATGELTTDVLDVGLVAGLVGDWSKAVIEYTKTEGPRMVFRGLIVILVLVAFGYLSKLVKKAMVRAMQSSKVKLSNLLKDMIVAAAKNLVLFIGLLFALSQLGISVGPLLAGLGIAGFIVGFALQDTLSNFASGLMILVYRPFDVGDFVDAGGITGKVDRMSLVSTTFKTLDNQVIVVPNNMIWQQVITNLTAQTTRRIDLTFGISYSDDIDKAKAILRDVVENHATCLEDPGTQHSGQCARRIIRGHHLPSVGAHGRLLGNVLGSDRGRQKAFRRGRDHYSVPATGHAHASGAAGINPASTGLPDHLEAQADHQAARQFVAVDANRVQRG